MKLSEIITRVQRQFGDDVQAQITKEDIVRWVNDACLEIATTNATNQGFLGTTPVVSGKSEYTLPPDLILLRSIRVNGMRLEHITYEQLLELDPRADETTGTPTHYWVYGGKVNLYPIPNDSLGNVHVMYVKSPDLLTVDMLEREPDVPKHYHTRIVEYCIAQAAELDDNIAQYQMKMGQFQSSLQNLRQNDEQPEQEAAYSSITYIPE